jgi:hypothetical protein
MKHSIGFLLFIASLSFNLTLVSCKKKCKVDELNKDSGEIIDSVVFYPTSGYMTSSMGGNYVVTSSHPYADRFEIKIGQGVKQPVDYTQYTILANPISATCDVAFEREVKIDDANQKVIYSVKATQCPDCESTNYIENYVLVPAFPSNYEVVFDTVVITK